MDEAQLSIRRRRLWYRCRYRGFREADLLLQSFARAWLDRLDGEELARFEALLDESDADIWDWVTERRPAPARHEGPVLERLRAFLRAGGAVVDRAGG
ncbi:MAG: succinate dehydrogenase assembly factor 2 [Geminicoccaceae bacterium]|nr:succinate dehydrogenase assembly factor 2 [Geminicoccaceae bacterium]MCS7268964.1 succinate dehydrogenase assembly factor 2 [Geminicoccaceae bacterium]MCX7629894.1 succinate dehydrogenase assembly factor 2 [Geminicoccaceae bacterium]MDW8340272.1 succinate dehydrogenase assembly factor 2 [Geminicoccaceae bacterium]